MILKKYRLITKEVAYLCSRKTRVYSGGLVCCYHIQYQNRKYFQFGVQISKKFHKSAVKRNEIKRLFYLSCKKLLYNNVLNYYKLFVIIGYKDYDQLNDWILLEKKDRTKQITDYFTNHLLSFIAGIGKKSL